MAGMHVCHGGGIAHTAGTEASLQDHGFGGSFGLRLYDSPKPSGYPWKLGREIMYPDLMAPAYTSQ